MTWDFMLDPGTRDLVPEYITGENEVVQRLITRLKRELGEWFLNTAVGLPWYGDGTGRVPNKIAGMPEHFGGLGLGILGTKPTNKRAVDLLIRRETLETDGVLRIVKMNTLFPGGGRTYTVYMEIFVRGVDFPIPINFEGEY